MVFSEDSHIFFPPASPSTRVANCCETSTRNPLLPSVPAAAAPIVAPAATPPGSRRLPRRRLDPHAASPR